MCRSYRAIFTRTVTVILCMLFFLFVVDLSHSLLHTIVNHRQDRLRQASFGLFAPSCSDRHLSTGSFVPSSLGLFDSCLSQL